MNNKKAFSLIEVIVATSILSIAVFGVYKLLGENSKLLHNSGNYMQATLLLSPLAECIENLGLDYFFPVTTTEYNFNFGSDLLGCTVSGPDLVVIDNIEYELKGIITGSDNTPGSEYIDWVLTVEADGVGSITENYKQIKN